MPFFIDKGLSEVETSLQALFLLLNASIMYDGTYSCTVEKSIMVCYIYEGGLKSFRPSLQLTRNSGQAAVGYGPGQEPVSSPH